MKSLSVMLLAVVALFANSALAQPSADAKASGRIDFYSRGARIAMRGARESVGNLREYVRSTRVAPGQTGVDKDTLASLDSIDRNLAQAKRNHATLRSCCLEGNVDATAAQARCQTIDASLGKAISEHDALMKRLGGMQPAGK